MDEYIFKSDGFEIEYSLQEIGSDEGIFETLEHVFTVVYSIGV